MKDMWLLSSIRSFRYGLEDLFWLLSQPKNRFFENNITPRRIQIKHREKQKMKNYNWSATKCKNEFTKLEHLWQNHWLAKNKIWWSTTVKRYKNKGTRIWLTFCKKSCKTIPKSLPCLSLSPTFVLRGKKSFQDPSAETLGVILDVLGSDQKPCRRNQIIITWE